MEFLFVFSELGRGRVLVYFFGVIEERSLEISQTGEFLLVELLGKVTDWKVCESPSAQDSLEKTGN